MSMVEWIWIHMAINMGVTSTAARSEIWKIQKSSFRTWWIVHMDIIGHQAIQE